MVGGYTLGRVLLGELARARLRPHWLRLLEAESAVRSANDPRAARRLRVAARRLRVGLQLFAPGLSPNLVAQRDELRWVTQALGPVRDLEAQIGVLEQADRAEELAQLRARRAEAIRELVHVLDGERFARLKG